VQVAGHLPYPWCARCDAWLVDRDHGYGVDAEQGDVIAGGGGICGGEFVWAGSLGEPGGGGADGRSDCAGCAGWAHGTEKEDGYARGGAIGHSGRPDDRERVFHLFCGGGDGVAVAAGVLFCAGGGDGFSAGAGDEGGAFTDGGGLGRDSDAADLVGTGTCGVALEPGIVCGNEVYVLLLPGVRAGADARAGGADRRDGSGCAGGDSLGSAGFDLAHGGILLVARTSGTGRGMEVFGGECGSTAGWPEAAGGGLRRGRLRR